MAFLMAYGGAWGRLLAPGIGAGADLCVSQMRREERSDTQGWVTESEKELSWEGCCA